MARRAVVVAGGIPDPADAKLLDGADLVVAADAGAAWLVSLGRRPDLLVGDLDSIDAELVDRLEREGVAVERHPADKDESDAELAVRRAISDGADEVTLLGALGGRRLDHELANLLLLVEPELSVGRVRIVRGATRARALLGSGSMPLDGAPGSWVTLLPLGGDVEGVRTDGLRYPLAGEALRMGASRGLSNVVVRTPASVSIERGTLLVIETATEGVET